MDDEMNEPPSPASFTDYAPPFFSDDEGATLEEGEEANEPKPEHSDNLSKQEEQPEHESPQFEPSLYYPRRSNRSRNKVSYLPPSTDDSDLSESESEMPRKKMRGTANKTEANRVDISAEKRRNVPSQNPSTSQSTSKCTSQESDSESESHSEATDISSSDGESDPASDTEQSTRLLKQRQSNSATSLVQTSKGTKHPSTFRIIKINCIVGDCDKIFANSNKEFYQHLLEKHKLNRYYCLVRDCGQSFGDS